MKSATTNATSTACILLSASFALLIMISCHPNKYPIDFEKEFPVKNQVFVFDPAVGAFIKGEKGTWIHILPGSIPLQLTAKDTTKLILREYYSNSAIVLAGLSTTSNGRLLETNGMIHLEIWVNSKQLDSLKKNMDISFPDSRGNKDYEVFYGVRNKKGFNWLPDSIQQNYHIFFNVQLKWPEISYSDTSYIMAFKKYDTIPWNRNYTMIDSIVTFEESGDTMNYATYFSGSLAIEPQDTIPLLRVFNLNWINCDRFWNVSDLTSVNVTSNKRKGTVYFLIFNDIHSIYQDVGPGFSNIPEGRRVSVIGINKTGDHWYFDMLDNVEITRNMNITLNLNETSKSEIEDKARTLDN